MVYFCKYAECISQTAKAQKIVFHIVFCSWMSSFGMYTYLYIEAT